MGKNSPGDFSEFSESINSISCSGNEIIYPVMQIGDERTLYHPAFITNPFGNIQFIFLDQETNPVRSYSR